MSRAESEDGASEDAAQEEISLPGASTHTAGGAPDAAVQELTLTVVSGPDAGARFASDGVALTVGTHRRAGAILGDATVSRFHCEISIAGGRPRVRDLGSLNGTALDGVAITDAWLRDGSTLTLGRTTLRVAIGAARIDVPASESERFGRLVGRSLAMRRVFRVLERAASTEATVLVLGETGTGKELAAESIHAASRRADGPFVVVDCGAIPADLLESELFGHEKGAFTGAVGAREGVLEAASGGTVFLDEIGELSADLQPKLLRALEKREVRRVGSNQYVPIDVRVIAATHRDLRAEVNLRRFRSDLYYRLAVLEIRLPPLRERRDDIPLLVEHFLAGEGSAAAAYTRSAAFAASVSEHGWPGNVRELRNYVERALAFHGLPEGPDAGEAGSDDPLGVDLPLKEARDACVRRFERHYLEALLARHDGNVTAAARAAGVDRVHLYRLLWRHGLK